MVGPQRVEAGRRLLAGHDVDIIVADDGLQHYALQRDIEIAVLDGKRALGNRMLLPAGPLREPVSRLHETDCVVINGADGEGLRMDLLPDAVVGLDGRETRPLTAFAGRTVHAVAGIGHPERFFASLRAAGLDVRPRAFPDHHRFRAEELVFADNADVVMTEKDAVKCRAFAGPRHWYLAVRARLEPAAEIRLAELLKRLPTPRRKDA
jgi:tetraacyldisaccharide 4'-kinase